MKQLYIILTNTLYGLGGGQLLTLRKAHFLKKMGYYVIIVYKARYGDFRLKEDFEEVRCIYIPEFGKPYNLVSNKNKKRALSTIIEAAGTYSLNESYIESHDTQTAIWGEVLSAQLGIPHFLYLIQETNMNRLHFYPYKRFYQYKLERNEFWGCNSRGLDLSFKNELSKYSDNYINVSFDENEVKDVPTHQFAFPKRKSFNTIIITTVTRVDKIYLLKLIEILEDLCKQHNEIDIQLRVIGGTVYEDAWKRIEEKANLINQKCKNLGIILTGYMVPGKDIYQDSDMYIGTGTAVINAISQKCITIPYNSYTNKTPGLFGVESKNFAYPEVGLCEYSVKDKILEVIRLTEEKKRSYKEMSYQFFRDNYSMEGTWRKFMQLSDKLPRDGRTYSFKYAKLFVVFDIIVLYATKVRDFFKK